MPRQRYLALLLDKLERKGVIEGWYEWVDHGRLKWCIWGELCNGQVVLTTNQLERLVSDNG